MPWGGAGGQNIEHPHTLVILSSFFFFFFFLLQMHFSFIGKVQFRLATLFCDSSFYVEIFSCEMSATVVATKKISMEIMITTGISSPATTAAQQQQLRKFHS